MLYQRWQPFVPAAPVHAHIAALRDAGMGGRRIAAAAGLHYSTVRSLIHGKRGKAPSDRVRAATAAAILAVTYQPAGRTTVDATGTHRRLQALVAVGWSQARLAARLGMNRANFGALLARDRVNHSTAQAVAALYDELWDQDPPAATRHEQAGITRARRHAADHGWAAPMAWDDDSLDDPAAVPEGAAAPGAPARKLPAADELAWLKRQGDTVAGIAQRFGVSEASVHTALRRAAATEVAG